MPKIVWSDFGSKCVKYGPILVRFSGEIGQIVSQIFQNFSQILLISTLEVKVKFVVFLCHCYRVLSGDKRSFNQVFDTLNMLRLIEDIFVTFVIYS